MITEFLCNIFFWLANFNVPIPPQKLLSAAAGAGTSAAAAESSFWGGIGTFFTNLFVPADDYFVRKSAQLSAHANEKLGGVADLYHMINDFFLRYNASDKSASG